MTAPRPPRIVRVKVHGETVTIELWDHIETMPDPQALGDAPLFGPAFAVSQWPVWRAQQLCAACAAAGDAQARLMQMIAGRRG